MTVFVLKLFALVTMIIDHTGAVLFPQFRWMRYVGRLSFPIYAFLISEGFVHTRSVNKFLTRLLVFALISEVPYDLAFNGTISFINDMNVFFTLFLGLLALALVDYFVYSTFLQCACVAALGALAQFLYTDYRFIGVCLIVSFYLFRDRLSFKIAGASNALIPFSSNIEGMALVSLVPICLYNGKQGRFKWKYFFYAIYPVHLLILVFIRDHIM